MFSPTVKAEPLKVALCQAGVQGKRVDQYNFTMTHLHGPLKKDIYMQQVPGFEHTNKSLVLKVNKVLYGLCQSARMWYLQLSQALKEAGFKQGMAKPCIFTEMVGATETKVLIFVGDMLYIYDSDSQFSMVLTNGRKALLHCCRLRS